jgi:hypothetical protein
MPLTIDSASDAALPERRGPRHADCQATDTQPIRLGRYFAVAIAAGAVGVGIWMLVLKFTLAYDWTVAVSVALSGFATYTVGVLALVAGYNWLSCKFGWRYIWALPAEHRFSLDYAVPAAVLAGIIGGWFVWQY